MGNKSGFIILCQQPPYATRMNFKPYTLTETKLGVAAKKYNPVRHAELEKNPNKVSGAAFVSIENYQCDYFFPAK